MPDHVLSSRVYFPDAETARNAYDHLVALAEHAAAHARVVGVDVDGSWVRTHLCYVADDNGSTSRCATVDRWVAPAPADADGETWETGVDYDVDDVVEYDGATYTCLQAHTSQDGWEPDAAPSLWAAA